MNEAKILFEIIKNFMANKKDNTITEIDEEKLYKLAKRNNLSNFLYNWSKENSKIDSVKFDIEKDYNLQIIKDTNENIELEKILKEFEKEKIDTVLLKGAVMKYLYPQNYMRQMCDIDILVHPEDFKRASEILKDLEYSTFYDYEKHLIFHKEPLISIEMHRKLVSNKDIGSEYLNNLWDRVVNYSDYEHIFQLNIEDTYIFCIIHLIIHFKYTGILARDILDVYLFNERNKNLIDKEYVSKKFEEFDLVDFEKNIKHIAYKWFGENQVYEIDDIQEYILNGRSINNRVNYNVGENEGKGKFLKELFFPNFKIMKDKYPILEKVPILLPVTWIARIFKDVFSKESKVKDRIDTIKLIQKADEEDIQKVKQIYNKLGIR